MATRIFNLLAIMTERFQTGKPGQPIPFVLVLGLNGSIARMRTTTKTIKKKLKQLESAFLFSKMSMCSNLRESFFWAR